MKFDEYMKERGDLMPFLLTIKIAAAMGDTDGVVEMVNNVFESHLEYLEKGDRLARDFYMSAQ